MSDNEADKLPPRAVLCAVQLPNVEYNDFADGLVELGRLAG